MDQWRAVQITWLKYSAAIRSLLPENKQCLLARDVLLLCRRGAIPSETQNDTVLPDVERYHRNAGPSRCGAFVATDTLYERAQHSACPCLPISSIRDWSARAATHNDRRKSITATTHTLTSTCLQSLILLIECS